MKWLIALLPLLWSANAASLAAAEGDCADCNAALMADTGVGSSNLQVISGVSRALASATPTKIQQHIFCQEFHDNSFSGLQETVSEYGYDLHDVYNKVSCDSQTKADLIRHRASVSTAGSDLMSMARYYIREKNDPEGLKAIFNRVIDNPGKPRGTLLDFIDYYSSNPNLSAIDKANFDRYESTIKRFGGMRESELP
tara:strand:- start:1292 stop:1882 length:591 start_codon:yes stop_codon:yes gene_type:complete